MGVLKLAMGVLKLANPPASTSDFTVIRYTTRYEMAKHGQNRPRPQNGLKVAYMSLCQFQYPHAGSLIFGKTACVCELIWEKSAFWNVSRRRQSKNTTLAHLFQPQGVFFVLHEKRVFWRFLTCFSYTNYKGRTNNLYRKKRQKTRGFRKKTKNTPWGSKKVGQSGVF